MSVSVRSTLCVHWVKFEWSFVLLFFRKCHHIWVPKLILEHGLYCSGGGWSSLSSSVSQMKWTEIICHHCMYRGNSNTSMKVGKLLKPTVETLTEDALESRSESFNEWQKGSNQRGSILHWDPKGSVCQCRVWRCWPTPGWGVRIPPSFPT